MFFTGFLTVAIAILSGHAVTAQLCESPNKLCYDSPGSTPQDVDVADIQFVASYLRAYGAQTRAGRQFTMTAATAPDCAEWSLYSHGSVLATARHINSTANSSVLFADIANTIDGGASATDAQKAAALIGCGTAGGSLGTVYDPKNAQYNTSTYLANDYTPSGILIKIVWSGAQ
ncbi:hypothetical protein ONS95_008769 [Cadophora gregata]|uniref:uncharacterized protein n=1 Tax=Cadophora gregata TaxID=51156 RepID=UPI0026DA7830|nr:uncharacterized protein ONS95_008769 [Cadophora gregata]KAK0123763.1 hypothetical protein ONS95_008769 [Cadophora gregata]KAK0130106.1 hypothetical protein ONS96_000639 [Cadophora gregata f. sp. sojae]